MARVALGVADHGDDDEDQGEDRQQADDDECSHSRKAHQGAPRTVRWVAAAGERSGRPPAVEYAAEVNGCPAVAWKQPDMPARRPGTGYYYPYLRVA